MHTTMSDVQNNEQILREKLAIERTRLANDRTLLAFIRTSLYFAIAGISVNSLLVLSFGWILEIGFIVVSVLLMIIGFLRYRKVKVNLLESRRQMGL